jgi:hypothetical protein
MTDTTTQTRTTTKSDEAKKIVRDGKDESEKRKEYQKRNCFLTSIREKIRWEELIESERKRFAIELTLFTWMTLGTKTNEILGSTSITL